MTKMTVGEFGNYLDNIHPKQIIYDSEEQEWYDPFEISICYRVEFDTIKVAINPNSILITGKIGQIYFRKVRYIFVEETNDCGDIVTANLVCGRLDKPKKSTMFTLQICKA